MVLLLLRLRSYLLRKWFSNLCKRKSLNSTHIVLTQALRCSMICPECLVCTDSGSSLISSLKDGFLYITSQILGILTSKKSSSTHTLIYSITRTQTHTHLQPQGSIIIRIFTSKMIRTSTHGHLQAVWLGEGWSAGGSKGLKTPQVRSGQHPSPNPIIIPMKQAVPSLSCWNTCRLRLQVEVKGQRS